MTETVRSKGCPLTGAAGEVERATDAAARGVKGAEAAEYSPSPRKFWATTRAV